MLSLVGIKHNRQRILHGFLDRDMGCGIWDMRETGINGYGIVRPKLPGYEILRPSLMGPLTWFSCIPSISSVGSFFPTDSRNAIRTPVSRYSSISAVSCSPTGFLNDIVKKLHHGLVILKSLA